MSLISNSFSRPFAGLLSVAVLVVCVSLGCGWFGGNESAENAANAVAEETPMPQFTNAVEAFNEGVRLLEDGETDKAIDALNQAIKLDPDHADAYFRLGIAYALAEFRDRGELQQATPTPLPGEAPAKEAKLNSVIAFERAVARYRKRIDANEEDHAAHYNLGRALNRLNLDVEAAAALREAVKLNPDDTEYQIELGATLMKLAKYSEAESAFKKTLEIDPDNLQAEELLERAEAGRKRLEFTVMPKDEKKRDASNTSNTNEARPDPKPTPPPATPKPSPPPPKPAPSPFQ
ncbi:MAG: tetratricopeptide repeat protein [Blastocatellia bacterium]|nr:tetratricopeptide repeat protein [Blastocatellia bacterium]